MRRDAVADVCSLSLGGWRVFLFSHFRERLAIVVVACVVFLVAAAVWGACVGAGVLAGWCVS